MYYFIINPHSKTGLAKEHWNILKQFLDEHHIQYEAYFTKGIGHATKIANELCTTIAGTKQIIIVGGDGTANEVINGLSNYHEVLLGYIPLGSSNDLARGLKLPKDPKQALELIIHPKFYRPIDHGQLTLNNMNKTRRFAVSSGIGFDAAVCKAALTSPLKSVLNTIKLGKLTYILLAIKEILTCPHVDAEIIVDSFEHIHVKNLVFIASHIHKYEGGGLLVAPDAKDDDQKLSVCLVSNIPRMKMLFLMPTIFFGKHTKIKGIRMINCKTLQVKTNQPVYVHTDGEIAGKHNDFTLTCYNEQIRMPVGQL
jgi:YegS/Rv2252/BmrU family lipid kinase